VPLPRQTEAASGSGGFLHRERTASLAWGGVVPVLRGAVVAALVGLALALALPALHLTAGGTGALVGRWWPVVLVGAGLGGMRRRGLALVPLSVGLVGLAWLLGDVLHRPVWPLLLAAALVVVALRLAGVGRLWRRLTLPGGVHLPLAGEIRLGGPDWRVENGEISQPVGVLELDLTEARLPEGTTRLDFQMGIGQITVVVPRDVGVRGVARLSIGGIDLLGHEAVGVDPHLLVESDDFPRAACRLDLRFRVGIGEVEVRRGG
jgi:hypothetical protein